MRYCDDGCIEIDNSAAERALRGVALGRKNYLFAGTEIADPAHPKHDDLLEWHGGPFSYNM